MAKFSRADLTNSIVYGVSAWEVHRDKTKQRNLRITPPHQPLVTVDDFKVAQFLHLLLKHEMIRDEIDSVTGKLVLILGRFTAERTVTLDALWRMLDGTQAPFIVVLQVANTSSCATHQFGAMLQ
jgi:hypothetical protein